MNRATLKRVLVALVVAACLTGIAASGLLFSADSFLSDKLYQSAEPMEGNVVVIGIDEQALEEIGPFPWDRDIMATAIETLNEDGENRPAAIGIDVLYTGETEPNLDERLVSAASQYQNVVMASAATFDSRLVSNEDGTFYMDDFFITAFDEPFEALKNGTTQGQINAMFDADGILRHSILYLDPPGQERVYSFSWKLYEKYAQFYGLSLNPMPPTDSRGFWYLPLSALPGAYYDRISVADLLNGTVPSDYFAGKIVLIGPYAAGLQDAYPTAIDHAKLMYGVEFQANAIEALIAGNYKIQVSDGVQFAILFFLSFGCLLWFWNRKVLPAALVWGVFSAGWIGICKLLYEYGYILHVLWIPSVISILFVITVAGNYIRTLVEKRKIANTFRRYVAPEIVSELLKEGTDSLELGGKLTDIAVLFVDIRGFTTMSEMLTAPEVVEILNKYLALTTKCVIDNQGTLDKFVGDCTMAIWNAPLPQDDYIFKSVKAAWDMVEGAKELSDELMKQYGRTVSFGVGVHCGFAVVGNIGAEMRMDYTAIGDTVNTSARLEANAPAGKIYISRAVADALEGRIRVTSLGDSIKLKGKADGFEILSLDGILE